MRLTWKAPFTFARAIGRAIGLLFAHKPLIASRQVADSRLAICHNCPEYSHGQCLVCCCFVDAKVWLLSEHCPYKPPKWL